MGMGRLIWTIRRLFFYGVIALIVCMLVFNISPQNIITNAFAKNGEFNLFYAYMIWSIPGLIIMVIISLIYAKSYGEKSLFVPFLRFLYEDITSPIYGLIQPIGGFIAKSQGREVDWGGVIWDFIWTLLCGGFILWGFLTQIV